MSIYLNILGFHIPSYGLMITLGVILANVFALYPLKKYKLIFDDFLILEAYTLLGAFIGAKLLYLIISYREIDWSRFLEPRYFNYIMSSGFVFYGGLIGGLLCFTGLEGWAVFLPAAVMAFHMTVLLLYSFRKALWHHRIRHCFRFS